MILPERIKEISELSTEEQIRTIHTYLKEIHEQLNYYASAKRLGELSERLDAIEIRLKRLEEK